MRDDVVFQELLDTCFMTDPQQAQVVRLAANYIAQKSGVATHHLFVVLGSGLKEAANQLGETVAEFSYQEFPGVLAPTAEGHGSTIFSVKLPQSHPDRDVFALVSTGRSHLYEGLSPRTICALPRIAAAAGATHALLTNAGGCLRNWTLGDVMAITDHINMTGISPFEGGVFTDISGVWDKELAAKMKNLAAREGVYAILRGPEYQTMAESRMLAQNGVDMVGMSTVLEAIALHQLQVRVCGLSVTSDLSFSSDPTTHEEVMRAVGSAQGVVREAVAQLATDIVESMER